jgi:hypothetical protein
MGGTHSAHDTFINKMNGVLTKAFNTTIPAVTQRSPGLDAQHGLILGGVPDYQDMRGLEDFLLKLAEIPSWRTYSSHTLHSTFAATERRGSPELTNEIHEGFKDMVELVHTVRDNMKHAGVGFSDPRLIRPRLLVSQDTLILACEPDENAFTLRQTLLNALPQDGLLPQAGAWGSGVTLARLMEPLDATGRDATNTWLANAAQYLPDSIKVSDIVVAAFTVTRSRFQFAAGRHAILALNS